MNCKPGDLAVVVSAWYEPLRGRLLTILHADVEEGWWEVELHSPLIDPQGRVLKFGQAPDKNLRPIRDPGDDARDETLDWLPVPTKEIA